MSRPPTQKSPGEPKRGDGFQAMKSTSCLHEIHMFQKAASLLRKTDSNFLHFSASYPWQASAPGDPKTELTPSHLSFWPADAQALLPPSKLHLCTSPCEPFPQPAGQLPSKHRKTVGSILPREAEGQASPLLTATCLDGMSKLGLYLAVTLDKELYEQEQHVEVTLGWRVCSPGRPHRPRLFSSGKTEMVLFLYREAKAQELTDACL